MTIGNTTKAKQHSISQALPIEGSFLKKHLCYFGPDGKKLVTTKKGQRRAKIETVPLPDFQGNGEKFLSRQPVSSSQFWRTQKQSRVIPHREVQLT
jgi:hypothetical protein